MKIFGDFYQIKVSGISNNFNQCTYLRSNDGANGDVIIMTTIALLIRIYIIEVCKSHNVLFMYVLIATVICICDQILLGFVLGVNTSFLTEGVDI